MSPGPVTTALTLMIARAGALTDGDVERHVQVCARQLASSSLRRVDVREAVARLVAAVQMLQQKLQRGRRRRAQHEIIAVERLLEVLQEELLPELRRQQLI